MITHIQPGTESPAPSRPVVTAQSSRDATSDVLRGLGIVAVVLYHVFVVVTGTTGVAGVASDVSNVMAGFMKMLEPARMPAIMFIAGYFGGRSLLHTQPTIFIDKKARGILYPFVIWSLAYLLMKSVNSVARGSLTADVFLDHLFHPAAHMWFLGYLFVYFAFLATFWKRKEMLLACAVFCLVAADITGWDHLNKAFFLFCFFAAGALMPREMIHRVGSLSLGRQVVVSVALFIVVAAVINAGFYVSKFQLTSLPISMMAVSGMLLTAGAIAKMRGLGCRLLSRISKIALEVYLIHWIVINIICVALPGYLKQLPGDILVLIVFMASLALTVTLALAINRVGMRFLFVLPAHFPARQQPQLAKS
jgi:peptidoglycan/LPS O-acetylase OafA/YrhL